MPEFKHFTRTDSESGKTVTYATANNAARMIVTANGVHLDGNWKNINGNELRETEHVMRDALSALDDLRGVKAAPVVPPASVPAPVVPAAKRADSDDKK